MQRSISGIALLFASVSAILGSGWLFASLYTSSLAGPAALISWLLGGASVILVAFVFAELCTMLPITGSSTRIPHFTHGTLVSFLFSWIIWLSYTALVPTEVQAVIQYLSYFFPSLLLPNSGLTHAGYGIAAILMLLISTINIFSLRWLLRCNNFLTILKLLIPILITGVIILHFFTIKQTIHPANSTFIPFGWHGIFAAIATGGIVFAFNGFKQACEMAGEAKKPHIALPVAIIGSVAITLGIYLLLQLAFYSSLTPANILHGWKNITLPSSNSPIAAILTQDHLRYLLPILYVGAIAGPLAAGLIYASSASRSMYGMSKNNHVPTIFQNLTTQGNPIYAILLNFALGMLLFAPLPGWKQMITFLTSLMAMTYAVGPVCLLALRDQAPNQNRPFRLPFARCWTFISFYICTLLIYWSGWMILSKLAIAMAIGLGVLFIHRQFILTDEKMPLNWQASVWAWPYFGGIMLISWLGNFGQGYEIIPFGWDFLILAVFCLGILFLAMKFKLSPAQTQAYIETLGLQHMASEQQLSKPVIPDRLTPA